MKRRGAESLAGFSYICIRCLEAMRKEHLPLQPGGVTTTNNLGEGWSHLYIQKWVRDEGNRSNSVNKCAKKKKDCDDTWNLLTEIRGALETESTSDI